MSASPNLAIPHVVSNQNSKEVTINEAVDALDRAIAGLLEVDVSAGGTITLDAGAALACKLLRLTGTLSADAEVIVPSSRKPYLVHNATTGGFAVTVRTTVGAGVSVGTSPDDTAIVYCDGTDVLAIGAAAGGAPYDIGAYSPGSPDAGAILLRFVAPRPFTLPQSLAGSQGYAGTPPAAQADFDIQKNGASIGTMTFATSASTATFTFASEIGFAAGDRLTLIAPATQDASLADVSVTLKGTRQ